MQTRRVGAHIGANQIAIQNECEFEVQPAMFSYILSNALENTKQMFTLTQALSSCENSFWKSF